MVGEIFVGAASLIALIGAFRLLLGVFCLMTDSMAPTLTAGDRILVLKRGSRRRAPRAGSVIVFVEPRHPATAARHSGCSRYLVKRVIATGGDVVLLSRPTAPRTSRQPVGRASVPRNLQGIVPQGSVFVMGDDQPRARDSREFGPVGVDQIVGTALLVFWPISRVRLLRSSGGHRPSRVLQL